MYLVIGDNPESITLVRSEPTYADLVKVLGDVPTRMILPGTPTGDYVAWVGDDFQARERLGEVQRNVAGSVFLWISGAADNQPYAGSVVLTGFTDDPFEGIVPASMDELAAVQAEVMVTDIRDLEGDGEAPAGMPEVVAEAIRAMIEQVPDMGYPPITITSF